MYKLKLSKDDNEIEFLFATSTEQIAEYFEKYKELFFDMMRDEVVLTIYED